MSTQNLCFEQKYEKYQNFISENLHFLVVKISVHLNRWVFHNVTLRRFFLLLRTKRSFEPQREKTSFWRAPNEYSNQPAHPWSLIRVFVVRMKTLCILRYPKCDQWSFRSVSGMRRLIWILPVAHLRRYVLSRCDGSFNFVYTLLYHYCYYYYYHC